MPKYNVNLPGVGKVLKATGDEGAEFPTLLAPMSGHVESAAAGCGNSGAIVPALDAFFVEQGARLKGIGQQINSCLTGAAAAAKAYNDGDLEMMATYQTNAAQAKLSEFPK